MSGPFVYLLSDHDEYGSQHVVATLDRSKLEGLIDENWPNKPTESEVMHSRWEAWRAEAKAGLAEHLARSDEELATGMPLNLHSGWGGAQLHVVKLR